MSKEAIIVLVLLMIFLIVLVIILLYFACRAFHEVKKVRDDVENMKGDLDFATTNYLIHERKKTKGGGGA
jgi:hypothetical protein